MSEIAILLTTSAICASGELNGKPVYVNVSSAHPMYPKMLEAYKAGNKEEVLRLADMTTRVNEFGHGHFEVRDGVIYINGCDEAAPPILSRKILDFAKNDLPVMPLVNFWKNLSENPSYRSREQLFGFLEANHVPLTEDGCFVAYKGVARLDDGTLVDSFTKTFRNNVGDVVKMDRSKVDDDPNRTCSAGLHVAAHNYAEHCYGGDALLHVKVNPRDVVSVPTDYDNQKMRVCEYTVVAVSKDRQELSDRLYEEDETTDVSNYMQSDERLRYVKPRADGSIEIPKAFVDKFGLGVGCVVDSSPHQVEILPTSNADRCMRPGFRVSESALLNAGIDSMGEYSVELSEDCTYISIGPA